MTDARVHAFTDDALADHDAVAVADLIRKGEISAREAADAAIARAEKVEPELNAVVFAEYDRVEPATVIVTQRHRGSSGRDHGSGRTAACACAWPGEKLAVVAYQSVRPAAGHGRGCPPGTR